MDDHDIFFIRHAESEANRKSLQFKQKHNLSTNYKVYYYDPGYMEAIRYNPSLIDTKISEEGVQQCLQAKKQTDSIDFDAIVVSPLERTLQTCELLFKGRNIPVFVEPVLCEAFGFSSDIGGELKGKVQRFPDYDFKNALAQTDLYFIKTQCQENQKMYMEAIQRKKAVTHEEKCLAILQQMREKDICDTPSTMRRRAKSIKEMLFEYRKKFNKIGVVTHFVIAKTALGRGFNTQNDQIVNDAQFRMKNCEVRRERLQQLMKYN